MFSGVSVLFAGGGGGDRGGGALCGWPCSCLGCPDIDRFQIAFSFSTVKTPLHKKNCLGLGGRSNGDYKRNLITAYVP